MLSDGGLVLISRGSGTGSSLPGSGGDGDI